MYKKIVLLSILIFILGIILISFYFFWKDSKIGENGYVLLDSILLSSDAIDAAKINLDNNKIYMLKVKSYISFKTNNKANIPQIELFKCLKFSPENSFSLKNKEADGIFIYENKINTHDENKSLYTFSIDLSPLVIAYRLTRSKIQKLLSISYEIDISRYEYRSELSILLYLGIAFIMISIIFLFVSYKMKIQS